MLATILDIRARIVVRIRVSPAIIGIVKMQKKICVFTKIFKKRIICLFDAKIWGLFISRGDYV